MVILASLLLSTMIQLTPSRLWLTSLWLTFVVYAVALAPPNDPTTLDLLIQLSTGQWGQLNPWVVSLFNLMGLWPLAYMLLLLPDGHRRSGPPAWPFVLGSFGLGVFAILPYLIMRGPRLESSALPSATGWNLRLLQSFEAWGWPVFLLVNAVAWLIYGWGWGDWSRFVQDWSSSRFIHVMSLDFCLLTLLFPLLLWQSDSFGHFLERLTPSFEPND